MDEKGIKSEEESLGIAIAQYFHTHMEGLHRYAYTILRNNEEAKDAVQTVFLKLWEKREGIDEQQSVQSWLYTSIYHYCLNAKRNAEVRKNYLQSRQGTIIQQEDVLVSKEQVQLIREALDSLPPKCRLIFHKSRFEKKKYAEIAQELNLSVKTIEVQMGKALRILREKLSWILVMLIAYLTI